MLEGNLRILGSKTCWRRCCNHIWDRMLRRQHGHWSKLLNDSLEGMAIGGLGRLAGIKMVNFFFQKKVRFKARNANAIKKEAGMLYSATAQLELEMCLLNVERLHGFKSTEIWATHDIIWHHKVQQVFACRTYRMSMGDPLCGGCSWGAGLHCPKRPAQGR